MIILLIISKVIPMTIYQLNDDALTSSLISVLKEQFASDVYHENA
jgi:hypothetical protein